MKFLLSILFVSFSFLASAQGISGNYFYGLNQDDEETTDPPEPASAYYVANSGLDTNNGTSLSTPWKTISKVNTITFNPNDTILFKRGDRWEETLIPAYDSIYYGAYGTGDDPVISGSNILTGTPVFVSGNLWKYENITTEVDQLFFDDIRGQLARTPNSDYYDITGVTSSTVFTSTYLDGTKDYDGANIIIRSSSIFYMEQNSVTQAGQTLTMSSALFGGSPQVDNGFFVCNTYDCLDQAGEWFHDTSTNTLYVLTPGGDSPANYELKASIRDNVINIDYADYVTIEDLTLEHSQLSIDIDHSENVTIDNCDLVYPDLYGILHTAARADYFTLTNSSIKGANANAIRFYSAYPDINNNTFEDTGLLENINKTLRDPSDNNLTACYIQGVDINFQYNRIINCGLNGLNWRGLSAEISYNFFDSTMLVMGDGGAIYSYAGTDYAGGDMAGAQIHHNIILNSWGNPEGYDTEMYGGYGIYMDNALRDIDIYKNVIFGSTSGICTNPGGQFDIEDNLIYDCMLGMKNADASHFGPVYFGGNTIVQSDRQMKYLWWKTVASHGRYTYNYGTNYSSDYNKTYSPYATSDYFVNKTDFADWQSAGFDTNGTYDGTQFTTQKEYEFYNDTKSNKSFYLDGVYKKLDGTAQTSPLILPPFTGIILIKQGTPTVTIGDIDLGNSYCQVSVIGNVTSAGASSVTSRGTVWSITSTTPTLSDNVITSGSGTGSFTSNSSSMPAGELIYFRNFASSSAGVGYSEVKTTTNKNDITGTANNAYDITNTSAKVYFDLNPNNNQVTTRTLYYRLSGSTGSHSFVDAGAGNTSYEFEIPDVLSAGTEYEYYISYGTTCNTKNTTKKYFTTTTYGTPPVYESKGNIATTLTNTYFNVAYPTTVDAGNMLLMVVGIDGNEICNIPIGWARTFDDYIEDDDLSISIFQKTAVGDEDDTGTITVGDGSATAKAAIIFRFSGALVQTSNFNISSPATNSGYFIAPFGGNSSSLYSILYCIKGQTSVSNTGTGWTENFDVNSSSAPGWTFCLATYTFNTSGTSNSLTSTWAENIVSYSQLVIESEY